MDPRGSRVLLTGATGGLGLAIATELAERGAELVLSGRSADDLAQLADQLPGRHEALAADLAEAGAGERLVHDSGPAEVIVLNAALPGSGRLESYSEAEIERAMRVNLEVPIKMVHAALPSMLERGRGSIVLIGSLSGRAATARASLYNASKFGLRGFALALREDLRGTGVELSLVSPGIVAEAGLFADSGAEVPPGAGTVTPADVGRAVADAIENNPVEKTVASPQQKLLTSFAHHFPRLSAAVGRRTSTKVADAVSAGQLDKR